MTKLHAHREVNTIYSYDLDQFPDKDLLPAPGYVYQYWLLEVFEIVLRLNMEHFLVLEFNFYPNNSVPENIIHESVWTCPYIALQMVDKEDRNLRNIGKLKQRFQELERKKRSALKELRYHKLYKMGLKGYTLKDKGYQFEYKRSFNDQNVWNVYYIKRTAITKLDKYDLNNIVDPECLTSYKYINIENHKNHLLVHPVSCNYYFKGKPLVTNTANLFKGINIKSLCNDPNEVPADYLFYKENGVLFSFDFIAFGKGQQIITDTFLTLDHNGNRFADEYEFSLYEIFNVALSMHCFNQHRIMGDGFIAAAPLRQSLYHQLSDVEQIGKQIQHSIAMIEYILKTIKHRAPNYPRELKCRCSILADRYYYGRIGGLSTERPELGGKNILKLQRQQSAVDNWFTKEKNKGNEAIYLTLERKMYEQYKNIFNEHSFSVDFFNADVKEFNGELAIVYKPFEA